MLIWHNGEILEDVTPRLPAISAGTTLGLGVFTTLGLWKGHPFVLDRHLMRLHSDSARLGLEVPYSDNEIALALQELIGQENIERGMARVTVTARGDGRWLEQTGCDLSIAVKDLSTTSDSLAPLKLILSQFRVDARRATSGIKSSSYADYQLAWRNAHHAGFDEAVLCNSAGALCEGTRSNIFWARGGTLYTPSLDCGPLPGIARALILEWARDEGTIVREGAFAPMEFGSADEVFTTSSTFGPRPVGSIGDDNFVSPGEITQRLMERWDLEVLSI